MFAFYSPAVKHDHCPGASQFEGYTYFYAEGGGLPRLNSQSCLWVPRPSEKEHSQEWLCHEGKKGATSCATTRRMARASAAGGSLEPFDGFAPGGGVAAAHGRIQPDDQAVTGNGPAAGAGFDGFRQGSGRNFRRREPIGAGIGEEAFGGGGWRLPLGDGARKREFQQCADLLLRRPDGFQDFARKPDTCGKEGSL